MGTTKKKATKKIVRKAKPRAKVTTKKVAKKAKGLLGRLAQRSAQLILASGVLGEPPRTPATKKKSKRRAKK